MIPEHAIPGPARLSEVELQQALALQRKGLTLSEIADLLGCPKALVDEALYWEVVR